MSHKDALWRFRVDTFGNSTEKTFLVQYLNRNIRIKELEGLVKCAPIDTVENFKLRRTLKVMKLERKQQSWYYNIIMTRCRMRAKRFERNASAGRVVMSGRIVMHELQRPGKYKKADSPADHDMAQHPLNSDVGG